MGRQTKTFRQTRKSGTADFSAKNYSQENRGAWHTRILSYFKVRGKGGV